MGVIIYRAKPGRARGRDRQTARKSVPPWSVKGTGRFSPCLHRLPLAVQRPSPLTPTTTHHPASTQARQAGPEPRALAGTLCALNVEILDAWHAWRQSAEGWEMSELLACKGIGPSRLAHELA